MMLEVGRTDKGGSFDTAFKGGIVCAWAEDLAIALVSLRGAFEWRSRVVIQGDFGMICTIL
jgi:hypothetical protein